MRLTDQLIKTFQDTLWDYYAKHGRDLPWRQTDDPYRILLSEYMLQQTQVVRVIPKYEAFLTTFPTVESLADGSLQEVLRLWSGLGYNRRAKFLRQTAQRIVTEYHAQVPNTIDDLKSLPGIGYNTAAAIMAYAYNQPVYFVETNVRTVYLYHFFGEQDEVPDARILEVLHQTLDTEHPREFYWALMDYGSFLKAQIGNQNHRSKHYVKQSRFSGSRRQVRGTILKALLIAPATNQQLMDTIQDERVDEVLIELEAEGLVCCDGGVWRLP